MLFGGLFAQSVRAVISNPTPVCVGTTCTLTFDSTGDYYLWTPPSGARNISFDLMGGQGGRTGGLGGRVQGSLASVPAALYIYVGGAGATGAGAAGGFNGGGAAGGSRGDEGSGGGATDIRSTTSINDRIAVAAGGGGTGGFFGGAGGAGGGQTGTSGTSGQGQGGAAGSQSAGGNGGSPNGGTWGTAGGFGIGGTGGTSSTSGGGGGGGGFYGGGGGGADVDACCTNGGGGGGGSSWSNPTLTSAVTHTAGYRSGAGVATISYVMPPSVTTFTPGSTLTNASSISYNLVFNESVTGLTNTDFVSTGSTASCSALTVSGSGSSYLVSASGCSDGTYKLKFLANSITGTVGGPTADVVSADVLIDRTAPTVTVSAPATPSSLLTLEYGLLFSESVTGLAASDFIVTGTACEVAAVSGSVMRYTVQVTRCADGVNTSITLAANSVSDVAANLGPATLMTSTTVSVDRGTLVVATPTPTPTPTPTASPSPSPTPSQNSAPAQGSSPAPIPAGSNGNGPSTGGTASLNQVSSLEIVAAQPVRKTYAFSSAIKLPTSPTEEPIAIYEPDAPQITIDNPTDDPPVAAKNDWQQYAIIGVGSLSGLLATIGITKGVRQMRTRRLVRKFA
ncbi:MAG: hypothetical protein RLZ41_241 [Actinomycetota bacterium]